MLSLSVKQPWAELIARGKKKKEFRTWTRSCFGELLIVASKSVEPEDIADEGLDVGSLVFGRAVCVVEFYKVTGDDGDYAWHLRNPRRVEPVEVRGSASLYRVPDERVRFVAPAKTMEQKAVRVLPKASAKRVRIPPRKDARAAQAAIPAFLEPRKRRASPKCPACGAQKSVPIEYGYPSTKRSEDEKRSNVEIGGCVITVGSDPAWRCRNCGAAFGIHEHAVDPARPHAPPPMKRKTSGGR